MAARDRISDGKYVVFKVEDFYEFARQMWENGWIHESIAVEDIAEPLVVMDATVLRDQDIFTPSALNAYADVILASIDIQVEVHAPPEANFNNEEEFSGWKKAIESLRTKAEFFKARALRASRADFRKVPD